MIAALRGKRVKQLSWEAARWNRKLLYLSSRYEWGTLLIGNPLLRSVLY